MLNKKRNCKKFQRFLKSILINFSPRVFAYLVIIDLVNINSIDLLKLCF